MKNVQFEWQLWATVLLARTMHSTRTKDSAKVYQTLVSPIESAWGLDSLHNAV